MRTIAFLLFVPSLLFVLVTLFVGAVVSFRNVIIAFGLLVLFYQMFLFIYFRSDRFRHIKASISTYTNNCNELNAHIEELKMPTLVDKSTDLGIGILTDNSRFIFSRKEWKKHQSNRYTHNCSATICKGAQEQPFKYLCKYFDIPVEDESLSFFEKILSDFDAVEQGKKLLENERDAVFKETRDRIPYLITSISKARVLKELGFRPVDLSDLYFPVYTFQYISAGGNSSMKCEIKLNNENLNKFVQYLSKLVKFRKSVAGQRAIMTSDLRENIKARDNYTCKQCGLSIRDERNLLLEIDHIIPLSKGGMTAEDNLQTLCWRCNRFKVALHQYNIGKAVQTPFYGPRLYMLHSLAHLLITAISLECGYPATAIRERIYCSEGSTPRAGILLYTGTPGSEGTLGGLIEVGRDILRHLRRAAEMGRLCSNDPVCAEHDPADAQQGRHREGAACHGCLLIGEPSCERQNQDLDRALVVPTIESRDAAFLKDWVTP